jgi:hypothetical protein
VKFKVVIIEMNPRIPWVLFTDPLGSAEHSSGNNALEKKLDVIKRYVCNRCTVDIANTIGIPQLSLRTMRKEAEKTKESCRSTIR